MAKDKEWVAFDLDGTLADNAWRQRILSGSRSDGDWDLFHQASKADQPVRHVLALLGAMMGAGYGIAFVTGRPEKWREVTERWIQDNVLNHIGDRAVEEFPLLMRPDDGLIASNGPVKLSHMEHLSRHGRVLMVIEDDPGTVRLLRLHGYEVLQASGHGHDYLKDDS